MRTPRVGAARTGLSVGGVVVTVSTFVLAEWHVAPFRTAMGWLAGRLALLLYVVAAVAVVVAMARRSRPDARPGGDRYRFVLFPAARAGGVCAFLVPLFGAWERGVKPPVTVAGLTLAGVVPYSDGTLWFGGAQRLLFDGTVDGYTAKRPLNPAFLAVRLALTGLDLRLALVLQAVLLGVAVCLLCRVVARHLGVSAALTVFAGVFGFTGILATTTYTEALAVTFGALAAAALWAALQHGRALLFAAGLFLLAVATSVRPGAVAVLLVLPLWFAWSRRDRTGGRHGLAAWPVLRVVAWPVLGVALAAVVAGMAVNVAASFATGGDAGNLNGNSTWMVYGLATGYAGWDETPDAWGRVYVDHPEILALDDYGRSQAVRKLAVQAVRDDPTRFVGSLVRSEANYVRQALRLAVPVGNVLLRRAVQAGVLVLTGLALRRRRRRRRQAEGWPDLLVDLGLFGAALLGLPALLVWGAVAGLPGWLGGPLALAAFGGFVVVGGARRVSPAHAAFLLVATAGLLVTLPVIGLDTARVLAATAPLMALPLALAVALLVGRGPSDAAPAASPPPVAVGSRAPVVVGGALVLAALLGAPLAGAAVSKPRVAARTCPDGTPAHALLGATSVRVADDPTAVDTIGAGSASRDLEKVVGLDVVKGLIRPGTTIVAGLDEGGNDRTVFLTGRGPGPEPAGGRGAGPGPAVGSPAVLYFCGGERVEPLSTLLTYFWPKPVDFAFLTGTPLTP